MRVPRALNNNGKHISGRSIQYQELSQGVIKQMCKKKPSGRNRSVPLEPTFVKHRACQGEYLELSTDCH